MRVAGCILVVLLLCLAFAGCLGKSGVSGAAVPNRSSTTTSAPPPAEVPNTTEEFGAIAGKVLDDEQRPLVRAEVTVVEPGSVAITDEAGAFTFNGLSPGTFSLIVNRVGYEQAARRVEVRVGEITQASFTLAEIMIAEPYQYTYDRVAYIGFGNVFLQDATWAANISTLNGVVCEPCQFVNHIPPGPSAGMTEGLALSGSSGVPQVNQDVWVVVKRNWTTGVHGDGKIVLQGYLAHRKTMEWTDSAEADLPGVDKLMIIVYGGLGVNFQYKIQIFNSLAYDGTFPEGFTALPPP